jgi:tetratricopeptide (TPR) repeat protein
MDITASQSASESSGPKIEGAIAVRELALRLGVALAWRPWPRLRLSARELGSLERALADAGYEMVGREVPPRRLRTRVNVVQARAEGSATASAGRRAWRAIVKLVAFAVGLTSFVGGAIAITAWLTKHSPRSTPLGGNLAVIVLPFAASASEQPATTALAHTVATTLRAQLGQVDPLVLPDVRWDPATPAASMQAQGRFAASLARSEQADAVMFGEVSDGELSTIAPYVYVSPQRLRQASELAGVYRLGSQIRLSVQIGESTVADGLARAQLAARARGLAEFVDAIGYYALGRYAPAIVHLRIAAASPSWATPPAQAMIDLFLGNATGKLASTAAELEQAAGFYRAALDHNLALQRAHFGLAEVEFQLAHGSCTAGTVRRARMASALAGYRAALAAGSSAPTSIPSIELSAKARFGIARVYLCLSQAGLTAQWPQAERELRQVITAYGRARFLRSDAAEAWADLALAELPAPGVRASRSAYLAALRSYTRAIELTLEPTARPALYANRAFVERQLGERSAAAADQARAGGAASRARFGSRP